jgi:hypothetical protein
MGFTRREVLKWTGVGGGTLVANSTGSVGTRAGGTRPALGEQMRSNQQTNGEGGLLAVFNALSEEVEFFLEQGRISDPLPPGDKITHSQSVPGTYTVTVSVDGGSPSGGLTFTIEPGDIQTLAAVGSPGDPQPIVFDDEPIDFTNPYALVEWYNGFFDEMDVVTCPLGDSTASKQPFRDIGNGETSAALSIFDDEETNVGGCGFELWGPGRFTSEPEATSDPLLCEDGFQYRGFCTEARDGSPFVTVQGVNNVRTTTYFWNLSDEPVSVWVQDLGGELQRLTTLEAGEPSEVFAGQPSVATVVGFGPVDADGPTTFTLTALGSRDYCVFLDELDGEVGVQDVTQPPPEPEDATLRVNNRGEGFISVLFNGEMVALLTRTYKPPRGSISEDFPATDFFKSGIESEVRRRGVATLPESCGSVPLPPGTGTLELVDYLTGEVLFEREVTIEPGQTYDLTIPRKGDPGFIESPIDLDTSIMTEMRQLSPRGI